MIPTTKMAIVPNLSVSPDGIVSADNAVAVDLSLLPATAAWVVQRDVVPIVDTVNGTASTVWYDNKGLTETTALFAFSCADDLTSDLVNNDFFYRVSMTLQDGTFRAYRFEVHRIGGVYALSAAVAEYPTESTGLSISIPPWLSALIGPLLAAINELKQWFVDRYDALFGSDGYFSSKWAFFRNWLNGFWATSIDNLKYVFVPPTDYWAQLFRLHLGTTGVFHQASQFLGHFISWSSATGWSLWTPLSYDEINQQAPGLLHPRLRFALAGQVHTVSFELIPAFLREPVNPDDDPADVMDNDATLSRITSINPAVQYPDAQGVISRTFARSMHKWIRPVILLGFCLVIFGAAYKLVLRYIVGEGA